MNVRAAGAVLATAVAVGLTGCDQEFGTDPTSLSTTEETTMTSDPSESSTAGAQATDQDPRAAAGGRGADN